MKKKIILIIILIIAIICIVGYLFYNRARKIEEITHVNLEDIAYIKSQDEELDVATFIEEYKNATFKKTNKFHTSTVAEFEIVCYDKQDNVILTIKVGNDYRFVAGKYDTNNPPKNRYQRVGNNN